MRHAICRIEHSRLKSVPGSIAATVWYAFVYCAIAAPTSPRTKAALPDSFISSAEARHVAMSSCLSGTSSLSCFESSGRCDPLPSTSARPPLRRGRERDAVNDDGVENPARLSSPSQLQEGAVLRVLTSCFSKVVTQQRLCSAHGQSSTHTSIHTHEMMHADHAGARNDASPCTTQPLPRTRGVHGPLDTCAQSPPLMAGHVAVHSKLEARTCAC